MDKGNNICCHNGSTDKDLRRICRSQYGHPGSAIGYLPERCLGHVYIVLKPVGSAHLTFDDDIVLYELCGFDAEHPKAIPMDLPTSPTTPLGPMTRARARAIENEVNSLLVDGYSF